MKVVTFLKDARPTLGILVDDRIFVPGHTPRGAVATCFESALSFIKAGQAARLLAADLLAGAAPEAFVPLTSVKLDAPIRPTTILCTGSNYRDHNREKAASPVSGIEPEFFVKTADCVIGPGDHIPYDAELTRKLDCETELAIVIGKPGRHIPKADALDHVFGYTIVNDVTARDRQVRRNGDFTWYELGRGKAFDGSAPLGPCIVTTDEIPDPQVLNLKTRINAEPRQSASTGDMIWSCADLVHFFSVNFTLQPGMIIITGTPAGTGWSSDAELGGRWHPQPGLVAATRYCLPGDSVECEISSIGVLHNTIL